MRPARVVEVNYHDFMNHLRSAADAGTRVEATDKERWKSFVKEHRIREASFMSIASSKGENFKPVIIADGSWTGYYIYSADEQVSLKFVPAEEN